MDIEHEKEKFVSLLGESYKVSVSKHDGQESSFTVGSFEADPRRLYLSGNTLEKFGFDYKDMNGFFWGVLCPTLKADGCLFEYQPYSPTSESFFLTNIREYTSLVERRDHLAGRLPREYWSMAEDIASGRAFTPSRGFRAPSESVQGILDEIEAIGPKIEGVKEIYHGKLTHEFVVNPDKLLPAEIKAKHAIFDETPEGASWRSVEVRLLDGRTIHFSIPGKWNRSVAAAEIGLEKKGNGRPKKQLELLEEATRTQGRLSLSNDTRAKESKRKQINALNLLLGAVFPNLSGEPFESQGGNAYQATFSVPVMEADEEF